MIKLGPFGGMIPKLGDRVLPDSNARTAANVKIQSGELRPIHGLGNPATINKTLPPMALFRARNGSASAVWFSWPEHVHCVRVPLGVDVESRFCWVGDGGPKIVTYTNAVLGGGENYPVETNAYQLGIPTPTTACSIAPSGGTGSTVTRFYRYTFVSQYGEESGPSPVSAETTGKIDGSWAVTGMQAVPANSGSGMTTSYSGGTGLTTYSHATNLHWLRVGDQVVINSVTYSVVSTPTDKSFTVTGDTHTTTSWARKTYWNTSGMYRRLYRTTGTTGDWQMVSEYVSTDPLYAGWGSATSFTDTYLDSQIAGDELLTVGWEPPPVDLDSLVVHPSGALCGIVGNLLCFSEPLQPHAWPTSYQLSAKYNGVGLGVYGSTVVMVTEGQPYVASGVEPASMSGEDASGMYPGLSVRAILTVGNAVWYASKHGIVSVGADGVNIVTQQFYTKDEWSALGPENMIFEFAYGRLYISYINSSGVRQLVVIDGDVLVDVSVEADELYTDPATGELYIGTSLGVQLYDDPTEVVLSGSWKSKEFVFPAPVNLGAAKVDFDLAVDPAQQAAITAARTAALATNAATVASGNMHGAINATGVNAQRIGYDSLVDVPDLPAANSVTINLYNGSRLMASRVVSSTRAFRLPSGYKADNYFIEVITQCKVKEIRVAETMDQLRQA